MIEDLEIIPSQLNTGTENGHSQGSLPPQHPAEQALYCCVLQASMKHEVSTEHESQATGLGHEKNGIQAVAHDSCFALVSAHLKAQKKCACCAGYTSSVVLLQCQIGDRVAISIPSSKPHEGLTFPRQRQHLLSQLL